MREKRKVNNSFDSKKKKGIKLVGNAFSIKNDRNNKNAKKRKKQKEKEIV